jgi:hypothetical protein
MESSFTSATALVPCRVSDTQSNPLQNVIKACGDVRWPPVWPELQELRPTQRHICSPAGLLALRKKHASAGGGEIDTLTDSTAAAISGR